MNEQNPDATPIWNYAEQIRAFEGLLLKNPWRLSRSAQALWNRLASLIDRQQAESVLVEGTTLARLMGATEKTFLAARAELEDQGLITCERGVKARPSRYTMKILYSRRVWSFIA